MKLPRNAVEKRGNRMLNKMMKSVLEQDRSAIVICDIDHTIVYMNPAAIKRYAYRGGAALIGQSVKDCHQEKSNQAIDRVVAWFRESTENNMVYIMRNEKENKDLYMVALRDDEGTLLGYYEKHEYRTNETAPLYDFSKSLV